MRILLTKLLLFIIIISAQAQSTYGATAGDSNTSDVTHSDNRYYRRHYHIVVDQTPDIQESEAIDALFAYLSNSLKDPNSKIGFDHKTDEISLYVFGLDGRYDRYTDWWYRDRKDHIPSSYDKIWRQSRNIGHTNYSDSEIYDIFLSNFIQSRGSFSTSGLSIDEFIEKKIKNLFHTNDSLAEEIDRHSGVTLSKYVYPAILELIGEQKRKPSVDDILIIVTNYQSGAYDMGTSADILNLGSLLDGEDRYQNENSRFSYFNAQFDILEAPFYKVPLFLEVFKVKQKSDNNSKNAQPVIDANKLGVKSLEGTNPFLASNLNINQKAHGSSAYDLEDVQITFNYGEDVEANRVELRVLCNDNVIFEECIDDISKFYDKSKKTYIFPGHTINLGKSFDVEDTISIDYTFFTTVNLGNNDKLSKVFSVTRDYEFTNENIISFAEDNNTIIMGALIVLLVLISIALLIRYIYIRRGRNCKFTAKINIGTISNERFLRVKNNKVTNLDCWYWDGIYNERGITVQLSLDIARPTFSKEYEYLIEAKVTDNDANYDFSFKPNSARHQTPQGGTYQANDWVPIDFNDMRFHVVAYLDKSNTNQPNFTNDNILKMGISIRLKRVLKNGTIENMVFQNGRNELTDEYIFIVRPKLENSNLWVAFDPGTSGSCIAYGVAGAPTDTRDLFVAQNTAQSLTEANIFTSVFPSKIRIRRDSDRLASEAEINAEDFVEGDDFYFGNLADMMWGNYNCFQSIKKLLGYHNTHKILVKNGEQVIYREISGNDLAHLLVKGLCNHFDRYIIENKDGRVNREVRELFLAGNSDKLAVERSIVAVPNSYTLDKIQEMVNTVERTGRFKEIHYIYESEAVFMTYLRENWAEIGNLQHDKIFIVYDMGGATINITAFKLKVDLDKHNNVDRVYVTTLAKIGYTIGGDDIDFALIQFIYKLPSVRQALEAIKPESDKLEDFILEHQKLHKDKLLEFVREIKLDIITHKRPKKNGEETPILKIQDVETFYGHIVELFKKFGVSLEIKCKKSEAYLNSANRDCEQLGGSMYMKAYVLKQVYDAVEELLKAIPDTESRNIELIYSGRSVLYPNIKNMVDDAITNHNFTVNEWDGFKINGIEDPELVKTAVAKGACWFGMYNSHVRLDHSILTTTLGFIDTNNAREVFVPLLTAGSHFKSGWLHSEEVKPIYQNLRDVRFVQMMGVEYDTIWREDQRHKYSLLLRIRQNQLINDIEYISMNANDCGEVECAIKMEAITNEMRQHIAGAMRLDITDDNSPAYIFATTNASIEAAAKGIKSELYESPKPTDETSDEVKPEKIVRTNTKRI